MFIQNDTLSLRGCQGVSLDSKWIYNRLADAGARSISPLPAQRTISVVIPEEGENEKEGEIG
jgi:hypothetical protein